MAIVGIRRITYGVDDLAEAARFFKDFGLEAARADDQGIDYVLPDESSPPERRSWGKTEIAVYCHGEPDAP